MKHFKNLFLVMLMAFIVFVVVGCGGSEIELSFEPKTYTVEVGAELTLAPKVVNEDEIEYKLVYSSADDKIATYVNGVVKGVKAGTVKVKVAWEKKQSVFAEATITVTAKAEVKEYTVSFNVDGGGEIANATVKEGAKLAKPADPTKGGHVFEGWFKDEAKTVEYDFDAPVNANLVLYAKWSLAEYTVTFDAKGGSAVTAAGVNHGEKVAKPADPTKANNTFEGWFTDEALATAYDFDAAVTGDLTLYAKWELVSYRVGFASNGGSNTATQNVKHGEKATKPADPTKDDYVFKGWFSDAELENAYDFNAEVTGALTLYAKWELDMTGKVTTEFVLDGGSLGIDELDFFFQNVEGEHFETLGGHNVTSGEYYTAPNPNSNTHVFVNDVNFKIAAAAYNHRVYMNLNANGVYEVHTLVNGSSNIVGGEATAIPGRGDYDYALFAHDGYGAGYKFLQTIKVGDIVTLSGFKFSELTNYSMGTISINVYPADSVNLGEPVILANDSVLPVPTKAGHEFGGWFDNAEFTGTALTAPINGKVYAKFEMAKNDLTLNYNGGMVKSWADRDAVVEDFLTDFYAYVNPTEDFVTFMHGEGKTSGFDGTWHSVHKGKVYKSQRPTEFDEAYFYSSKAYMEKWLPFFDMMQEFIRVVNAAQNFYGDQSTGLIRLRQYIINVKPATYVADATMLMVPKVPTSFTIKFTAEDEITLGVPAKENHVFGGWFASETFAGSAVTKVEKGASAAVTLYAKWDLVKYDVEFESNEGTVVAPQEVEHGSKVVKPADPTREGFLFNGWFKDAAFTQAYDFDAVVTSDLKLYASWTAFVAVEVNYQAHVNEDRETYYIRVTFPIALLESDIKTIHTYMSAGVLVEPVELGIVAGDPYLWFGVAKLDGINTFKENGRYAYKVVLLDDTELIYYFDYDRDLVTHLPGRLSGVVDYKAVLNTALETHFIKISVPDESLHANAIKSIRTIKVAGALVTPVNLTPNTDTVMWFSVADYLGILGSKQAGVYGYEVVKNDDTKYVFEFEYNPELVTDLPELQNAVVDYQAVWNATRETWYIEITTPEDLDETTIKSISLLKEAGVYLSTPVELIPDTDKVMWFGVAKQDGDLAFKGNGEYIYKVVRQDDSTYVFRFVYDSALVEGILHTIEFESNEGSVVDPLVVEKRELAEKPVDPTRLGYTFKGWFKDAALTQAFDWDVPVNANYVLYAKWEIIQYNIEFNLAGGEFDRAIFSSKDEMKVALLTDFYAYVNPAEDLDTFIHGTGNTSGFAGTWHSTHKAKIYSGPRPTVVDEAFFVSSALYMDKWLPFFDMIHDLVVGTNSTQFFFGAGTWTGLTRLDEYMRDARYADVQTIPEEYILTKEYTIATEDIILEVPVKAGYNFLGWFDNPALAGDPIVEIEKGSTGDLVLYAKWDDSAEVSTYAELVAALVDENVLTIYLLNDIELDAKLVLLRSGVTIIGNGFTLSLESLEGWQGDYILQVYKASNVTLVDLGFDGGDAALLVNGSVVKLEGTITLQNHEFGGIEVSYGVGVTTELILELADGAKLVFADESAERPAIWEDQTADHLIGAHELTKIEGLVENQVHYYLNISNHMFAVNYELNGGAWSWTVNPVSVPKDGIDADSDLPEIFMQDFFTWLVENDNLDADFLDPGVVVSSWEEFSVDMDDPRALYNWNNAAAAGYGTHKGYNQFYYDTGTGLGSEVYDLVGGFLGAPGYKEKYASVVQHLAYMLITKYSAPVGEFWNGPSSKAGGGFVLDGYFYGTQGLTTNDQFNALRGVIPTPTKGYKWNGTALEEVEYDFFVNSAKYSENVVLPIPSRLDYFFKGWYDNPEFSGERIVSVAANTIPAAKYYAKWEHVDFEKVDQQKILVDASLDKLPGEIFVVNGVYYQEGLNAFKDFDGVAAYLQDGMTINVASGTYAEALVINKDNVTILGPNAGVAAGKVNTARDDEAIMTKVITVSGVEGLRIDGIALTGAAQIRSTSPVKNILIENINAYAPNVSAAEAVVFFAVASASATNEDIIIRNSAFNDTNGTGYRGIRVNNSVDLEILNNYFYQFVDVIRPEGQNNAAAGTGAGASGKLYIKGNVFEDSLQYSIWIGNSHSIDLQIHDNSFAASQEVKYGITAYGSTYVNGYHHEGVASTMDFRNNDFLNNPQWHNVRFQNIGSSFTAEQLEIKVNENRFHILTPYMYVNNQTSPGYVVDATNNYFLFNDEIKAEMFNNATYTPFFRQGVAQYSGATGNMVAAPANNAETVGLDEDVFEVLSIKNQQSNEIGLNAAGQIRLYSHRQSGDGNRLEVSIASGYKIIGVEFEFVATQANAVGELALGTNVIELETADMQNKVQTYSDLDITEFSLYNISEGGSANPQILIKSITITYVEVE